MSAVEEILRKILMSDGGIVGSYIDLDDGVFDVRVDEKFTDEEKALMRSLSADRDPPL